MPIIKSAAKQMRQDKKRHARNLRVKRDLRNATKAFMAKPTFDGLRAVQSEIDTAVKKNILKKNTAARKLSRLSRIAKDAGVKLVKIEKKATSKASSAKASTTKAAATKKPATKTASKKPAAKKATGKTATAKKTTK